MRDWTYSKTISSAETFTAIYKKKINDTTYETATDTVVHSAVSEVITTYETVAYTDKDGAVQTQDVVARTVSQTTTCVGAANGARWQSKLQAGSPAYPGTTLIKVTETENKYVLTVDGPVEVSITTLEYEPVIAFAGGLPIDNYKNIDLGTGNTLVRKTIVDKEEDKAADLTKETTTVYEAWGATAAGKSAAAEAMSALKKRGDDASRVSGTYALVENMKALVLSRVDQAINVGRGVAPSIPTVQDQQSKKLSTVQDTVDIEGPWGIRASKTINGSLDLDKVEIVTLSFNDNFGNDT
jgi:hypothetical protein